MRNHCIVRSGPRLWHCSAAQVLLTRYAVQLVRCAAAVRTRLDPSVVCPLGYPTRTHVPAMQREHPAALIVVRIMLILAECVIYGVPDGPLILPLGVREFGTTPNRDMSS